MITIYTENTWCVRKQYVPLHRQKTNNRLFRLVVIDLGFSYLILR